ncbi:hypothetical protein BH09SUM1_BH09SUM1_30280 [soil metagenome]
MPALQPPSYLFYEPVFGSQSVEVFISTRFEVEFEQEPVVLVDIGASGGLQPHWKPAQRHLKVIGFEPDKREFGRLAASAPPWIRYFNTALADKPGPVLFHLLRKQMTSSIFEPNLPLLRRFPDVDDFTQVETVSVEADTLDRVLGAAEVTDVDFIKIDTQGAELSILRGGVGLLDATVFGMELEVEFLPIYKGQPLFAEVDEYARSKGYELFDLRPFRWKKAIGQDLGGPNGQIAFADALYFKSLEGLAAILAALPDRESRRRKTLRCIAICILYGYLDYALELFETHTELFDKADKEAFQGELKHSRRRMNRFPDFRGRWRTADAFYRLSQVLDPTNAGWSIGGRRLGNRE